jgi:hypothetical protein
MLPSQIMNTMLAMAHTPQAYEIVISVYALMHVTEHNKFMPSQRGLIPAMPAMAHTPK